MLHGRLVDIVSLTSQAMVSASAIAINMRALHYLSRISLYTTQGLEVPRSSRQLWASLHQRQISQNAIISSYL